MDKVHLSEVAKRIVRGESARDVLKPCVTAGPARSATSKESVRRIETDATALSPSPLPLQVQSTSLTKTRTSSCRRRGQNRSPTRTLAPSC